MTTKKILLSIVLFAFSILSYGQSPYNSIYTKYGFGQINNLQSTYQLGQGGLSLTDAYYNQVNISNPASYTYIARQLPIFDVALNSEFIEASTIDTSRLFKTTEVANFTLALPTGKKSGLVFSYLPFSKMGYNITDSIAYQDTITQINQYKGNGSINRLILGYGRMLFKADSTDFNISFGTNFSYLFGAISNNRQQNFESTSGYLSFLEKDSSGIKSFLFDLGIYANYNVGKTRFVFGSTYSPSMKLKAKNEHLSYLYIGSLSSVVDTISADGVVSGNYLLPGTLSLALSAEYNYKLGVGVQMTQRNMADYSKNFINSYSETYFTNSVEYNVGTWYKPAATQYFTQGGAFKNATYKVGLRYKTLGLKLNATEITEMAVSTGINLPMVSSGSFSSINFGIEFGKRGTVNQNLVQERFVRAKIGIAITPSRNDRWFVKRKYN